MCKSKWIELDADRIREYDIDRLHYCRNCKRNIQPYFVHDSTGDYTCFLCNSDGDVKYFCKSCANTRRSKF